MTQTELFALVGFIILIVGAVTGAWWRVESKVKEAKEAAYHKCDEANLKADAAASLASLAREELSSYKTYVAEHYISKAGHRETMDQVMAGLNGVKTAVDGTNQRIDRLFDARPQRKE